MVVFQHQRQDSFGFQHGAFSTVHDFWIPQVRGHRCGKLWYQHHERLLKKIENDQGITLPTFLHHQRELFQFGAGDPQVSSELAHFPMGVQEQCCYLGASVLEAGIPFLGSLTMMSKLGFILDIPNKQSCNQCSFLRGSTRQLGWQHGHRHHRVPEGPSPENCRVDVA